MIRTNEICDYLPAGAWRDFRNALTDLDTVIPDELRHPHNISSIIRNSDGVSVSDLHGFVLSSTASNGFIYRSGRYKEPILLFSGIPRNSPEPQRYELRGRRGSCCMYTDEKCASALIWASATYNRIEDSDLSDILMDSGISYIPRDLFIEYSDACLPGVELLYNGGQYPDPSVNRVKLWLNTLGVLLATGHLSFINTALNSTYQSRGVVRRLAVEHGLIKRA